MKCSHPKVIIKKKVTPLKCKLLIILVKESLKNLTHPSEVGDTKSSKVNITHAALVQVVYAGIWSELGENEHQNNSKTEQKVFAGQTSWCEQCLVKYNGS